MILDAGFEMTELITDHWKNMKYWKFESENWSDLTVCLTQLTENLPELPKTTHGYPLLSRFTRHLPYLPRTYWRGYINVRLVLINKFLAPENLTQIRIPKCAFSNGVQRRQYLNYECFIICWLVTFCIFPPLRINRYFIIYKWKWIIQ